MTRVYRFGWSYYFNYYKLTASAHCRQQKLHRVTPTSLRNEPPATAPHCIASNAKTPPLPLATMLSDASPSQERATAGGHWQPGRPAWWRRTPSRGASRLPAPSWQRAWQPSRTGQPLVVPAEEVAATGLDLELYDQRAHDKRLSHLLVLSRSSRRLPSRDEQRPRPFPARQEEEGERLRVANLYVRRPGTRHTHFFFSARSLLLFVYDSSKSTDDVSLLSPISPSERSPFSQILRPEKQIRARSAQHHSKGSMGSSVGSKRQLS